MTRRHDARVYTCAVLHSTSWPVPSSLHHLCTPPSETLVQVYVQAKGIFRTDEYVSVANDNAEGLEFGRCENVVF